MLSKYHRSFFDDLINFSSYDRLFDSITKRIYPEFATVAGSNFFEKSAYPKVNIKDYPDRREIYAALPGLQKEDITITLDDGMLILQGQKVEEENEECEYILHELKKSSFSRTFGIDPKMFDLEKIDVTMDKSILKILIPRKEKIESKVPKKILIK